MRLGNTLKQPKPYEVPARNIFDVVAANDVASLLTVVRGVNPFDVSPGIHLILEKMQVRPDTANPYVSYTEELDIDKENIATARDAEGNTPLHIACAYGYTQVATILVRECDCSLHAFNAAGMAPLHLAARNGHLECVQMLIHNGASPLVLTRQILPPCVPMASLRIVPSPSGNDLSLDSRSGYTTEPPSISSRVMNLQMTGQGNDIYEDVASAAETPRSTTTTTAAAAAAARAAAAAKLVSSKHADWFFCGRTPLFLAHWHQHDAVAAILEPYFSAAQPLNTHNASRRSVGSSTHAAGSASHHSQTNGNSVVVPVVNDTELIVQAALRLDKLVFAQIFDVLDCRTAPCRRLIIDWVESELLTLREVLPRALLHLLPLQGAMMPEQVIYFHSIVVRGLAYADTIVDGLSDASSMPLDDHIDAFTTAGTENSSCTVLQWILNTAQTAALRVLMACGLDVRQCEPRLSKCVPEDSVAEPARRAEMMLLLQELEARMDFEDAMNTMRRGGKGSKAAKQTALREKANMRKLQAEIAAKSFIAL